MVASEDPMRERVLWWVHTALLTSSRSGQMAPWPFKPPTIGILFLFVFFFPGLHISPIIKCTFTTFNCCASRCSETMSYFFGHGRSILRTRQVTDSGQVSQRPPERRVGK